MPTAFLSRGIWTTSISSKRLSIISICPTIRSTLRSTLAISVFNSIRSDPTSLRKSLLNSVRKRCSMPRRCSRIVANVISLSCAIVLRGNEYYDDSTGVSIAETRNEYGRTLRDYCCFSYKIWSRSFCLISSKYVMVHTVCLKAWRYAKK